MKHILVLPAADTQEFLERRQIWMLISSSKTMMKQNLRHDGGDATVYHPLSHDAKADKIRHEYRITRIRARRSLSSPVCPPSHQTYYMATVGASDQTESTMVRNANGVVHDGSREHHGAGEPFLFTSESVGEGHPDKLCDQISDAVLDAHLKQDPYSKVACETVTKNGKVLVCGEITSSAKVDYEDVVRQVLKHVGYDDIKKGIDYKNCEIEVAIDKQNDEIANGVHRDKHEEDIGAGDQGLMFGYASDETEECMPLTVMLAHKLNAKVAELRRDGTFWWAGPDSKTQVTCEYLFEHGAAVPLRVHTVVVSLQHTDDVTLDHLRKEVMERVVLQVIPEKYRDDQTIYYINPCGRFVTGGPMADAGLTGRKIIVDTYGGWGAHGGGAFSGKDPTKVDRSAAYAARWVAKSLVAAGLCRRCLVQLSYAIGISEPLSIAIFSYGTSDRSSKELLQIVKDNFDLRPGKIIRDLKLKTPFYQKTCVYGHFGRPEFPWETPQTLKF